MDKKKWPHFGGVALMFALLWLVRLYKLQEVGPLDYDSVKNFLIIQEMAAGDFSNFFHHASPAFFFFFWSFYEVFGHYFALEGLNALVGLYAIWLLVDFFSGQMGHRFPAKIMAFGIVGTSVFLVHTSRYLSVENLTLLLFALALKNAWRYFWERRYGNWWAVWFFLGLSFTVSYRSLLIAPFFLLPLWQDRQHGLVPKIAPPLVLPPFIALAWMLVGKLAGTSWLAYAKFFYACAIVRDVNPILDIPNWQGDWLFYLKYLFHFENPLLFIGWLLLAIGLMLGKMKPLPKGKRLFWGGALLFVLATFALMSFLQKAPRGILHLYPLLYLSAFEGYRLFLGQKFRIAGALLVVAAISYHLVSIKRDVYAYSATNYPEVAQWLADHGVDSLVVTVGIGVVPFLPENTQVQVLYQEEDWGQWAERGYRYALLDGYHAAAGLFTFEKMHQCPALIEFTEPTLLSPLLFLEHCEFSNLSFEQSLSNWKAAAQKKSQLHILKWGDCPVIAAP